MLAVPSTTSPPVEVDVVLRLSHSAVLVPSLSEGEGAQP